MIEINKHIEWLVSKYFPDAVNPNDIISLEKEKFIRVLNSVFYYTKSMEQMEELNNPKALYQ
jgi:hypothetical protein